MQLVTKEIIPLLLLAATIALTTNASDTHSVYFEYGLDGAQTESSFSDTGEHVYNTSLLSCAFHCARLGGSCNVFVWGSTSHVCLLAPTSNFALISTAVAPGPAIPYHVARPCPFSLGYQIRYAGVVKMCLRLMGKQNDYYASKATCEGIQGTLAKINTRETIDLLVTLFQESYPGKGGYVGVDGLKQAGGPFYWRDGSAMTAEESLLFPTDQPNFEGDAWMSVEIEEAGLNDLPMDWEDYLYVLCEMVV